MAYPPGNSAPAKLSFAKIAAMPAPNMIPALPSTYKDNKTKPSSVPVDPNASKLLADANGRNERAKRFLEPQMLEDDVDKVRLSVEELSLVKDGPAHTHLLQVGVSADSYDDGQSQISSSSLKQQSFDTTSQASVTTFAMDEKESIRPDDSASVRAVEDDETLPGFSRQSSFQHESEPHPNGQRVARIPTVPNVTIAARRYPGLALSNPPRFGDLPVSPVGDSAHSGFDPSESPVSASGPSRNRLPTLAVSPDEKLLEALASLKDRLPLLQLEERFVLFVVQSREDVLDLPPQNSFNRLLTHKLADYYGLAHQVNEDNSSVKIFRTSSCALPTSLADIAKSIPIGQQQVSAATQMKIMRRAQLGRQFSTGNSTAASSSVPSKATSENGAEVNSEEGLLSPVEGTPGRDKPRSREEREAQYKAVRERIFGDFQESVTSESGSTGETSASMSRSSSTSGGKKKSRKQKTPKDDSFTRRSEFVAYGPMHMQQAFQPAYHDAGYPDTYQAQNGPYLYGPNQMLPFPNYDPNLAYGPHDAYSVGNSHISRGHGGWDSGQAVASGAMYNMETMQPIQHHSGMIPQVRDQFSPAMQPVPASPGWMPPHFANSFVPPAGNNNNSVPWQHSNHAAPNPTYQFGQASQSTFGNGKPYGSHQAGGNFGYNAPRSLFNPQTRSFVPNNAVDRGGGRNGRKKGAQNGGNTRITETSAAGGLGKVSRNDQNFMRSKEDSLQQKYGTPANLPKKPPPSQVSPHFAGDPSVGSSQAPSASTNSIPHVSSGGGQ